MTQIHPDWQSEWVRVNKSANSADYINQIRSIEVGGQTATVIFCRDVYTGDDVTPLGAAGRLHIFSRRRIRTPYHVTLRTTDEPRSEVGQQYSDWHWQLRPQDLEDALGFAFTTDSVVTMSTVKSGASKPLKMHFQAVPQTLEWKGVQFHLFESLLQSESQHTVLSTPTINVSVQNYPVFVARIAGQRTEVCEKVLRLCLAYDHLQAFNLIISRVTIDPAQPGHEVVVFFFPRRFDGKVVPTRYIRSHWAFGSFELGGVFLAKDEQTYRTPANELREALCEVAIPKDSLEQRTIENLLVYS